MNSNMTDYRNKCLSVYDEACLICDDDSNVSVHHINGDRSNNNILNLMPVCPSCHRKIHSGELSNWHDLIKDEPPLSEYEPVPPQTSSELKIDDPTLYKKVRVGSRGRVSLDSEFEGEVVAVAVKKQQHKKIQQ